MLDITEAGNNLYHFLLAQNVGQLLVVAYSAGLRVSETVSLTVKDIDSQRMLIHVRQGKGQKDRYTLLSKKC